MNILLEGRIATPPPDLHNVEDQTATDGYVNNDYLHQLCVIELRNISKSMQLQHNVATQHNREAALTRVKILRFRGAASLM